MKPYNILFVSSTEHMAGGELNLIALLNTIQLEVFSPILLFNPLSAMNTYIKHEQIKEINIMLPAYSFTNFLQVAASCMRHAWLLYRYRIDLVYFNTLKDLKFLLPALLLFHVPFIIHLHIDEKDETLKWNRVNLSSRILFPSESTMKSVLAHSSWINPENCFYVHNGVDTKVFHPMDPGNLKKELGLKPDYKVIGIFGQLKEIKGQHLFLELVKQLKVKDIKAHYLIVGDDNVNKGEYLAFLKNRAKELNISQEVFFLGYRKDIPELMSLCDLTVVPSLREPFGRVIIESMACGTPVVASAIDGTTEIFKDGEGGFFCAVNDYFSLTEKVNFALTQPFWLKNQSKIALKIATERFNQEIHTKIIEEHILEVLGNAHK